MVIELSWLHYSRRLLKLKCRYISFMSVHFRDFSACIFQLQIFLLNFSKVCPRHKPPPPNTPLGRCPNGPLVPQLSVANKYVGSPYCWAKMYAGRVACCPLVSHDEYAPRALSRLKKTGQTNRRQTTDRYITLSTRCGQRNNRNKWHQRPSIPRPPTDALTLKVCCFLRQFSGASTRNIHMNGMHKSNTHDTIR